MTVGYGYRPWLAAIWLALLLTAGTAVYAIDRPHALPGGPVPPFNAFVHTLDLPIRRRLRVPQRAHPSS